MHNTIIILREMKQNAQCNNLYINIIKCIILHDIQRKKKLYCGHKLIICFHNLPICQHVY